MQMQTVCVRVCVCARVHAYRDVYESQTHVNMFDIIPRQWCALTLCLTKLRTKDNVWWCLRLHQCESVRNLIWSNAWYCIYYIIFKSFTENFWTIQGMLDIEFSNSNNTNSAEKKGRKNFSHCSLDVGSHEYINTWNDFTMQRSRSQYLVCEFERFFLPWSLEICHFNKLTWNSHKMLYDKMELFIFFQNFKCIYSAFFAHSLSFIVETCFHLS